MAGYESGEDDELDALLDSYAVQAQRDVRKAMACSGKPIKGQAKSMAVAREEGLAQPIDSRNKGFQLLRAMGYQQGTGLGRDRQGTMEPVAVAIKPGRTGLGVDERKRREREAQQLQEEEERAKLARTRAHAEHSYKAASQSAYEARRAHGQLWAAWRCAQQLDEQAGVLTAGQVNEELLCQLPTLVLELRPEAGAGCSGSGDEGGCGAPGGGERGRPGRGSGKGRKPLVLEDLDEEELTAQPCNAVRFRPSGGSGHGGQQHGSSNDPGQVCSLESAAPDVAAEQDDREHPGGAREQAVPKSRSGTPAPEVPIPEQLLLLLRYLRLRYSYCLYCGCRYDGDEDMQAHCPGELEVDH